VKGDVPGDGEPDTPDEGSESRLWSIEDFDDFEPVELLDGAEPGEPELVAAVDEPDSETDSGLDEDTEEFEPVQPGFAFAEDAAENEALDPPPAADQNDEPGFGELWASRAAAEDESAAEIESAPPAAVEYAPEASERPPSPGAHGAYDPPDSDDGKERDEDAAAVPAEVADDDATTEFVPPGVAPAESTADEPAGDEPDVAAPAAAVAAAAAPAPPYDHEADAQERLDEITTERLYSTSTQEYAGLAEHVARAADEDQELMAVAADMPGLERGIVGLDDVVEASGVEDTPTVTRRSSDLPLRIGTAILLLAVFIGSLYRPLFLGLLALLVLGLAAGEFYTVLVRSGYNPLTVFGLAGVAGAMVGTWVFGPVAIPMSIAAALLLILIFYTVVAGRSLPLFNAALTMMVAVWIALGAFVFDMVQSPDFRWLIVAFIVTVAFMDISQYFVGRRLGRTPLAPRISPKKTVEGLVGGIFGALFVGVFFGLFDSGPFDLGSGLLLGLLVAVVAPFGDLAISVVKRALDVKDMGTILPGHGGVLDRIDAMLVVVPVVWVAYAWLGLLS
jgi:phosphatidate cytidylyltransferase